MANNLDILTASFGTQNVEPVTGETASAAYRTQVARNTGYNYYRPDMIGYQPKEADREGTVGTALVYSKAYMSAGTYTTYAIGWSWVDTAPATGLNKITVDGTTIVSDSGTNHTAWVDGSATVIVTTTGWIDITYFSSVAHEDSPCSLRYSSVFVRQTH